MYTSDRHTLPRFCKILCQKRTRENVLFSFLCNPHPLVQQLRPEWMETRRMYKRNLWSAGQGPVCVLVASWPQNRCEVVRLIKRHTLWTRRQRQPASWPISRTNNDKVLTNTNKTFTLSQSTVAPIALSTTALDNVQRSAPSWYERKVKLPGA